MTKGSIIGGKYEILTEIGRGGMSVVYLAMDKNLNKQWAIKEVRKRGVSKNDEIVVNSLMAEANLIKRLDHSAFPRIVDIIDNGQTIYIVMDYIEGESLDKILKANGPQPEDLVIHWAMQICDALSYLHSQKPHPIIYRDMKPANLMLKPEGEYGIIKIIDFGIAREFKDKNLADTTVLGTRGYASPEHYAGHTDERSDIYSLGMTMHHLLTGVDPREGVEYASVRNYNPDLSEGIEIIIDKCVQPAPENRYQSCEELLRDLNDPSKLTHDFRKKQKLKLGAFLSMLILSIVMLIAGFALKGTANRLNSEDYESLIGLETTTPHETKVDSYKRAISIYPGDLRAYTKLLEAYEDNGQFGPYESAEFLNLYNKYSDQFTADTPELCELRYKIGTMYFNYYLESQDGEPNYGARAKLSQPFFEANYRSRDAVSYQHQTISDCFYWVSYFYNTYLLDSNAGKLNVEEAGKSDYEELIRNLTERFDDIKEEGPYNKLTLDTVVFNLLYSERDNLAKQEISQDMVFDLFQLVYNDAMELKPNKSQAQNLQNEIDAYYQQYYDAILASYQKVERERSGN